MSVEGKEAKQSVLKEIFSAARKARARKPSKDSKAGKKEEPEEEEDEAGPVIMLSFGTMKKG